MTVTGHGREGLAAARPGETRPGETRPGESGTGIPPGRTPLEGLADRLARLAWCWPPLLTLALGLYQMGRPELWRDELASWSFASRPVSSLIASARHTGATQLAYYLLLHGWMAAFGDSAGAMRTLSVLAMAGAAACVALVGRRLAGARAGLHLSAFAVFGRNLFYSTSVATALIVLALLAWAVAWREAAFMTALAIAPVAAVWLLSQGEYSYFFPRYLLFTAGAWAILAGIGLSRLDARIAAAAVLVVAILGAGDQQVIREPGAHSWSSFPVGRGGYYLDYAGAAAFVARRAHPGDGAVCQGREHQVSWLMISDGLRYYLSRDMPNGVPAPHQLFVARSATQAGTLYPQPCRNPAACLGGAPRIWIAGSGRQLNPYQAVTPSQAAVLRPRYRLALIKHVRGLTVFLLTRVS